MQISLTEVHALATQALQKAGASLDAARATVDGLLYAEMQGTASHGLSRVPQYCGHLAINRVKGAAVPKVARESGAVVLVDAGDGLAFPACNLAIERGIALAKTQGIALAAVTNSYHFGAAIYYLEAVAKAGMVGLAMTNSPAAMAVAGGKRPLLGTNPIAAMFPRAGHDPVAIDLALSEVARGKLMVAAKDGKAIPLGWALDASGVPTTDPAAGLKGSMAPVGSSTSHKGAMLALMVELIVTALTGAQLGYEADSFFDVQGNHAKLGHSFLIINPAGVAGSAVYAERVEALLSTMLMDEGVRVPGARRYALQRKAEQGGLNVPDALVEQMRKLGA